MSQHSGPKVDSALIGAAGEHRVLSRLLTRGFLASPASPSRTALVFGRCPAPKQPDVGVIKASWKSGH